MIPAVEVVNVNFTLFTRAPPGPNARAVNLAVLTDPAHMLVEAAQPANVDTVIIDGRIVKRGGRLIGLDVGEVIDAAARASAGVRQRSGWTWPSQR